MSAPTVRTPGAGAWGVPSSEVQAGYQQWSWLAARCVRESAWGGGILGVLLALVMALVALHQGGQEALGALLPMLGMGVFYGVPLGVALGLGVLLCLSVLLLLEGSLWKDVYPVALITGMIPGGLTAFLMLTYGPDTTTAALSGILAGFVLGGLTTWRAGRALLLLG